jgi:pyroglutamyl-peptidase
MHRVLLTAYGPYDDWPENASWLVMQELLQEIPQNIELVTRLYPVDFGEVAGRLEHDVTQGFDTVLALGQAPGRACIALEGVGINWACDRGIPPEDAVPLDPNGPAAYSSTLPLKRWTELLRGAGIPAEVSFHAGTYLCNAALYWAHHFSAQHGLPTRAAFLHLPLATQQVVAGKRGLPSLPVPVMAHGVRLLLDDLAEEATGA